MKKLVPFRKTLMTRNNLISFALLGVISSSSFADESAIYNDRQLVDASKIEAEAPAINKHPTSVTKTTQHYPEFAPPELNVSSKISFGYLIPDGLNEHAEDGENGVGIEAEVHVNDYRFKGHFDSMGLREGDTTKDVETMGFEIGYSLYRGSEANFMLSVGWERVDIAGEMSGFTNGDTAFTEHGFSSDTTYALLGVEYALTSQLSAELAARWDFSHDDVSLTLNGNEAMLYEDLGFSASINYALTDTIGVGLYHEKTSELMSSSRIEFQYKF